MALLGENLKLLQRYQILWLVPMVSHLILVLFVSHEQWNLYQYQFHHNTYEQTWLVCFFPNSPILNYKLAHISLAITTIFIILITQNFLELKSHSPKLHKLFNGLLFVNGLLVLYSIFAYPIDGNLFGGVIGIEIFCI